MARVTVFGLRRYMRNERAVNSPQSVRARLFFFLPFLPSRFFPPLPPPTPQTRPESQRLRLAQQGKENNSYLGKTKDREDVSEKIHIKVIYHAL